MKRRRDYLWHEGEVQVTCRAVAAFSATHPDVTELSLKNFVVVGPNDKAVPWIMECRAASRHRGGVVGLVGRSRGVVASHATLSRRRYTRKTKDPMNNLDKPIYRTNAVRKWAFHHNSLKTGRSKDLPPEKLHFNHVRVPRLVNTPPTRRSRLDAPRSSGARGRSAGATSSPTSSWRRPTSTGSRRSSPRPCARGPPCGADASGPRPWSRRRRRLS